MQLKRFYIGAGAFKVIFIAAKPPSMNSDSSLQNQFAVGNTNNNTFSVTTRAIWTAGNNTSNDDSVAAGVVSNDDLNAIL